MPQLSGFDRTLEKTQIPGATRGNAADDLRGCQNLHSDKANLDQGTVWPAAFALKELTAADEVRIGALVKQAVSRF